MKLMIQNYKALTQTLLRKKLACKVHFRVTPHLFHILWSGPRVGDVRGVQLAAPGIQPG